MISSRRLGWKWAILFAKIVKQLSLKCPPFRFVNDADWKNQEIICYLASLRDQNILCRLQILKKCLDFVQRCAGQAKCRFKVSEVAVLTVAARILPTCTKYSSFRSPEKETEPTAVRIESERPKPNGSKKFKRKNPRGDTCFLVHREKS